MLKRLVVRRSLLFAAVLAASLAALVLGGAAARPAGASTAPIAAAANEFAPNYEVDRPAPTIQSASTAPRVIPSRSALVTYDTSGLSGFAGLNLVDTRTADGGNAYSIEPPDQGLCSDGTSVMEAVNSVFTVYTGTTSSGNESLNQFFTGDLAIDRSTGAAGTFLSDPKCYWDPGNHHWYFTVLEIDSDTASHTLIAVTKGTTPTTDPNDWYHYSIDTTNAGGTAVDSGPSRTLPSHFDCPCFGDQPLIGADQYGFYVTTNEFSITGNGFNGAQIYALDKNGLANGVFKLQYVRDSNFTGTGWTLPLAEGYSYSLQPATSPTAASWASANGGTEYMLSALDFNGTTDNRVATWALVNTSSLASATPNVQLLDPGIVSSETYGQPPVVRQKPGPTPLADAFGFKAHEATINSNDDRMNQAVYADGKLWAGLNTAITTANADVSKADRTGIAWFVVSPSAGASQASGTMANQGYIALDNNDSAIFPSIGVNDAGKGVITFSVSGIHYYPSAAYATIDASGVGPVHIAAAGGMPADGFTGLPLFGGPPERWGDYSAAAALPDGSVWMATEWIPGTFSWATGPWYANWGTYVMHVTP